MSYIFLLESGEESLAGSWGEMCALAPSSWTRTVARSCSSDNEMRPFRGSPSGTTCEPSTGHRGVGELTSWQEDSLAPIFPPQGIAPALEENTLASGEKWPESFAKWDLISCSWKTPLTSLFGDSTEFSGTWPRWGSMRNGAVSARIRLALPTVENALGLLPTLLAADAKQPGKHHGKSRSLSDLLGGPLNPRWCEWFVGIPAGWASASPLETSSFQRWLTLHLRSSRGA